MNQGNKTRATNRDILRSMNYNVILIFIFYIISSIGTGIWMGNVLSTFIYLFAENAGGLLGLSSNELVGVTSAASGLTMTIFVFPAGYFADKLRRDLILKVAAFIGLAAIGFIAFGNSIIYIFICLLLWGLFNALVRPSLEALFADSVESGYRSKIYSWANLARQIAMATGPFLNIILFVIFGNDWNLGIMKNVMYVGLAISIISIIIMFFFKDERALNEKSEAIAEEVTTKEKLKKTSRLAQIEDQKLAKIIPLLLIGSNVIIGIGAGMTVKFFSIFFMLIYEMKPIFVQLVLGITSLATGILGVVAQKLSLKSGRAQMIFIVQFIATACLLVISIYPPIYILIPIFIARGSFMNAAMPLSRSIIMDIIPKHNRGKWNSLQAIAWGLFWNISAVIGGFIVGDNNNFNLCFIITTFIYILGMVPIIILMPIVGKEREALDMENDQKVAALTRENQMKELDLADETFYKTKDKEIKEPNPNLD